MNETAENSSLKDEPLPSDNESNSHSGESIEEYLKQHETLIYRNVGVSMLPLLKQGRDLFTLTRKTEERCRKYDVALFRKAPHVYVLHRVVEVRDRDYVFLGDNCITKETGITDQDILGVMVSFVHNGKNYNVDDFRYRIYVRVWCALYPARVAYRRFHVLVGRAFRKLGMR